jgi:integrase
VLLASKVGDPNQNPLFGYSSRYSLTRILQRSCKRAGVEYLSPHKAGRHTFAARLLRNGASLKELQQAGGWDDIGVVARNYAHIERSVVDARVRGVATTITRDNLTMDSTMRDGRAQPLLIHKQKQRAA